MIKANTVEQYYILQWLKEVFFNVEQFEITLLDRNKVLIKDSYGDTATVKYNGKDNIELI